MTTIVLAAGLSERMGRNKLLLPFRNEPIIIHTIRNALEFSDRVIVVTGNEREKLEKAIAHLDVDIVFNPDFREGQRMSSLLGVENVEDDDFAILPGDLPLLGRKEAEKGKLALSGSSIARLFFNSIPGHPVFYRKENRDTLLSYPHSMKSYLKERGCRLLESTAASVFDIDTPEKYQTLIRSDGNLSILEDYIDVSVPGDGSTKNSL